MSVWVIRPRDPLIFRDGKPFNATPGVQAQSLPFPYPSTLAGGMRTRIGRLGSGKFTPEEIDALLRLGLRGPLLVSLDAADEIETWYLPAPADCLTLQAPSKLRGRRLWIRPVTPPEGALTDLEGLHLLSPCPAVKEKPHKQAPRFWRWSTMEAWLSAPSDDTEPVNLQEIGIAGLTSESRIHVSINPKTGTASEGFLFQTVGLEFADLVPMGETDSTKKLSKLRRYALAIEAEGDLTPGIDFLGGERRMVHWQLSAKGLPECPTEIRQAILTHKHCRLVLATPALFQKGYLPTWVCQNTEGLRVHVKAAAVPRYQGISGWDVKARAQKASRRMAPAGSVYFLSLEGDDRALERFVDAVWMQSVSDDDQDRRDGFGLALLGVWDGSIQSLEVKGENAGTED